MSQPSEATVDHRLKSLVRQFWELVNEVEALQAKNEEFEALVDRVAHLESAIEELESDVSTHEDRFDELTITY